MANPKWTKGMKSPNPKGRKKGSHNKKHMAIRKALLKIVDPMVIAKKLYELVKAGDIVAIKYVCDRLEGRPKETLEMIDVQTPSVIGYYPTVQSDSDNGESYADEEPIHDDDRR